MFFWVFYITFNISQVIKFFAEFDHLIKNISVCSVLLPVIWYIVS